MLQTELLKLHIDALFLSDGQGRLTCINEPWDKTKPAPLLYAGTTVRGEGILRVRRDMEESLSRRLTGLMEHGKAQPRHCMQLLQTGTAVVEELCYHAPKAIPVREDCVLVTAENIGSLDLGEFVWLREEIHAAQPCCALVENRRVLSVCRSVRIAQAHEAGIETAVSHRGLGYAQTVLAAWLREVRRRGAIPLYSTLVENAASRRLAEKSGLELYAEGFHIH